MAHNKATRRISTLGSRFTSMISVCLVLLLLGIGAMAGLLGKGVAGEVRRNVGFVVKLERECPDDVCEKLGEQLRNCPAIASVDFLNADSILAQEKEYLGENLLTDLDENPFSPEFNVNLHPGATSPDSVSALTSYFGSLDGVEEVVSENAVIAGVDNALRRIGTFSLIGAIALLFVAIALINNTVSLSIYSRLRHHPHDETRRRHPRFYSRSVHTLGCNKRICRRHCSLGPSCCNPHLRGHFRPLGRTSALLVGYGPTFRSAHRRWHLAMLCHSGVRHQPSSKFLVRRSFLKIE